jgi:hypothetical protein
LVSDKEKSRFKIVPALSTRINTEGIASRRHSSCSSRSLVREVLSRQTNILKIEDEIEEVK